MNSETPQVETFHASVAYYTRSGRPGLWSGEVRAVRSEAHGVALAAARRARRAFARLDRCRIYPAQWVRP